MKPFDLEAAKRGEPIQTRDGRKARFVAHVPEAATQRRVIALVYGDEGVSSYGEDGLVVDYYKDTNDLFMAPRKHTVWVNFYDTGCHYFPSQMEADVSIYATSRIGGKAYPVEIDDE